MSTPKQKLAARKNLVKARAARRRRAERAEVLKPLEGETEKR